MRSRLVAGWIVLAGLIPAVPALAWPYFDVTASEVLSVDPPRVRTTFTINESGPTPFGSCGWAAFSVAPLDPGSSEAPQLFSCAATSPWTCVVTEFIGVSTIDFFPQGGGGDSHHGNTFSIVTDRAEPCVRVEYICVILLGSPAPPFEACLAVDMPVPTAATSWGSVKVRYR